MVNNGQVLEEQLRLNERLKVGIDAMKKRKEIEQEIAVCEKKKLWIEYNDLRSKVMQYKEDKNQAEKLVKKHEKDLDPIRRVIDKARSGIGELEKKKLNTNREIHTIKDSVQKSLETVREFEYKMQTIEENYQEKLDRHRNREREIEEAKVKLDKLNTDKVRLAEKVGDPVTLKKELADLYANVRRTEVGIDKLETENKEIQYDYKVNILTQIRQYEDRVRNLQDVGKKRLEVLRNYSEDTYKAVMWLRQNGHLFRHEYYEPMVLEINFTDPKFARYLESTVNNRDLIAFTFESSTDMNVFMKKIRNECGLKQVNAICSAPSDERIRSKDISHLSYLGFYTVVSDTITGPEPIIRYLCNMYQIHKIPIGNDHTYTNSGKVPDEYKLFFTANHRFSVRVSAYSGAKSSSISEIRPARLLANAVDLEQLDNAKAQLSNFQNQGAALKKRMQDNDEKKSKLEQSLNFIRAEITRRSTETDKIKVLTSQISVQRKKLTALESEEIINVDAERAKCQKNKQECVMKQIRLQEELVGLMKSLQTKLLSGEPLKVQLDLSRQAIVDEESKLRALETELLNLKTTLSKIEQLLSTSLSQAKEKLREAKQSCKSNKMPNDPEFPYNTEFDRLPVLMSELHEHICELQARMVCLDQGNEEDIKEYEEREKEIKRLKREVENSSNVNKELEDKMTRLRNAWLPPLEELLNKINRSFGNMFAKLDCAGEVKLEKTGEEYDYDRYGISILVKFRSNEVLQQLTRHTQSGGERALTTAVYLMALQGLTTVPFRCVDEINQGMDPINERKMFHLLVNVTTECDNAQYFLLTPKLLTNLDYNDKITVLTIMNGKRIVNYKKWNYDNFLRNAIQYGQN